MPTNIYGLYAGISGGTQDSAASMDIPVDGVIEGIDWDGFADMDADAEECICELSFISTNQLGQNDVRGRISSISTLMSITTSGVSQGVMQKFVGPMELFVAAGERVHLHVSSSAGVGGDIRCNIHVNERTTTRRAARRR